MNLRTLSFSEPVSKRISVYTPNAKYQVCFSHANSVKSLLSDIYKDNVYVAEA